MVNIIIGVIGVLSVILFLWLSGEYGFSLQEQTISSILLVVSTLLINVITSIFLLHRSIKLIRPTLCLPAEEQKEGYEEPLAKLFHDNQQSMGYTRYITVSH